MGYECYRNETEAVVKIGDQTFRLSVGQAEILPTSQVKDTPEQEEQDQVIQGVIAKQTMLFNEDMHKLNQEYLELMLRELGYESLEEYLASDLWKETEASLKQSVSMNECAACGSRDVQIRHWNYAALGNELTHRPIHSVVAMCDEHYQEWMKAIEECSDLRQTGVGKEILKQLLQNTFWDEKTWRPRF